MMWMTFFGEERFHLVLEDAHPHDASHAEENAFEEGDAADAVVSHGHDEHDELHAHGDAEHDAGHDDHDDDDEHHHALPPDFHPHESPVSMWLPLAVLAVLSTFGGLVGIPYAMSSLFGAGDVNVFEHTLDPVIAEKKEHSTSEEHPGMTAPNAPRTEEVKHFYAESPSKPATTEATKTEAHNEHSAEEISTERGLAVLSVVLALLGIFTGWFMFKDNPLRKMPKILEDKWRVDEFYNGYIVDPLTRFSVKGLWQGFDLGVIDGIVNGAGYFVTELGNIARRVQVGFVRSYAAFILFGALIVIGYFIYYGLKLIR
jgi:NADH-quinone oxidoreductase subunit L